MLTEHIADFQVFPLKGVRRISCSPFKIFSCKTAAFNAILPHFPFLFQVWNCIMMLFAVKNGLI